MAPIPSAMTSPNPNSSSPQADVSDQMDTFWEKLVESDGDRRRAFPRVRAPASVTFMVDGGSIQAPIHDIGRGGVQIRCERAVGARIAPAGPRKGLCLQADVALPDGDQTLTLSARLSLAHVTLLHACPQPGPAREVAMGFSFEGLDAAASHALETFIMRALEPAS